MKLHTLAFVLVVIGALNWGLSALGYNVVEMIFGHGTTLVKLVYLLVGASAVYEIVTNRKNCKHCANM